MKRLLPIFFSLLLLPSTPVNLIAVAAPKTKIIAQAIDPGFKNYIEQNTVTVTNANGNEELGILLGKQNNQYLVLTSSAINQGNTALSVKTNDGAVHQASVDLDAAQIDTNFSLLEFSSNAEYVLAELNPAAKPSSTQEIFVVGKDNTGLVIERGKVEGNLGNLSGLEQYNYRSSTTLGQTNKAIFDDFGALVGFSDGKTNSFATLNSFLQQLNPEVTIAYDLKLPETAEQGTAELTGELQALAEKARQITVKIQSSSGASGSGVIIQQDENVYTVLTSAHVVCEPIPAEPNSDDCADRTYSITTANNESKAYEVEAKSIKQAEDDVDLAKLEFKSEANHQVATLANYAPVSSEGESYAAIVSGLSQTNYAETISNKSESQTDKFDSLKGIAALKLASAASDTLTPNVSQEISKVNPLQKYFVFAAGYAQKSPDSEATWQFSPGYGLDQKTGSFSIYDRTSFDRGYQLVYTCITYGGMSGGPILDVEGRVVGIHGKAEGEKIEEKNDEISLGYSLAIPIGEFNNKERNLPKDLDLNLGKLEINTNRPQITSALRQNVIDAILTTKVPQSNADSCQWVKRGNQQWRTLDYEAAKISFNNAIAKQDGQCDRLAWYGIGLSLIGSDFTNPPTSQTAVEDRKAKYKDAAVAFRKASKFAPDFAAAIRRESIAWRAAGETEPALAAINKAIKLDPDSSSLYNDKGALHAQLNQIAEASAAYNRAIKLDRTSSLPHYNLGLIFGYQEEWQKAIAKFDESLVYDLKYAPAYFNRGNAYYASGDRDKARSNYETAIELESNYPEAHHNLGYIYDRQSNYDAALEKYDQAIALNNDYRRAYLNRARVYAILGRWSEAEADYDWAIDTLNASNAETYLSRGLVRSELNNIPGAVTDIQKAKMLFLEAGDNDGSQQAEDFLQQVQQQQSQGLGTGK